MMTLFFEGNITGDPELRFTPAGTPVATISVADNRRWQDSAGVWHDDPTFVEVTLWKDLADNAVMSLKKGMRVEGSGRLEQQSWVTDAGDKRSKLRCVANSISVSLRFATIGEVTKTAKASERAPEDVEFAGDPALAAPRKLASVPAATQTDDTEPF